jgi:hypothetical protein
LRARRIEPSGKTRRDVPVEAPDGPEVLRRPRDYTALYPRRL